MALKFLRYVNQSRLRTSLLSSAVSAVTHRELALTLSPTGHSTALPFPLGPHVRDDEG